MSVIKARTERCNWTEQNWNDTRFSFW